MDILLLRRLIRLCEPAILLTLITFFCFHSLPRAFKTLNTDFPNYYLAAQLTHQGTDTSRMYEWQWFERQKDLRPIDIRVIGLLPITPPSTLILWPLTFLGPMAAKHLWILLNLLFAAAIARLLRSLTSLSYTRLALLLVLSFPLYRNLLYGQLYIFLLLLIVASCWAHLRGRHALSGSLLAVAAVLKVFPALLFIFFLQRKNWRSLIAGTATAAACLALSIAAFGLQAHLVWLRQILPWVLRGEGLGTYTNTASFSAILHCLFLYEPQWNPHPRHSSLLAYSVLSQPLPILVLAPAILLLSRYSSHAQRVLLEWSALLTASLAISTIPASYNFVLILFPVSVLASTFLREKRYIYLAFLIAIYLSIGYPLPVPEHPLGLKLLLYVPRLPLLLALLFCLYTRLARERQPVELPGGCSRYAWTAALLLFAVTGIPSTLALQRAQRAEYAYRLPITDQGYLNASPQLTPTGLLFTSFTLEGYRLMCSTANHAQPLTVPGPAADVLSFAAHNGEVVEELAFDDHSYLTLPQSPSFPAVQNARNPIFSHNGKDLAYIHDMHGHGHLMLRPSFHTQQDDVALSDPALNVYEASLLSPTLYAFSATRPGSGPDIYLVQPNTRFRIQQARYPALSPDHQWLAYSHFQHGFWNIRVRNLRTSLDTSIASPPCNQVDLAWQPDSKTLLYATDCGRSVWFTALAQRKIIP